MSDQYEELVVTTHGAGDSITVDHWPKRTRFRVELLENADPRFLTYAEDHVTIMAANGERTYLLEPVDDRRADQGWPATRFGTLVEQGG